MCYAIPGKVVELDGKTAIVEYYGEKRKAHNEIADLKLGDYIYAQGGFVINRISEAEAMETLNAWKDVFFSLQKTDLRLSRLDLDEVGVDKDFISILDRAAESKPLKRSELLRLLSTTDKKEMKLLFKVANFLRQKHLKNACCVHGIIEISNYCKNDCVYCGIRQGADIPRYRMTEEEIYKAVDEAVNKYGFKALVLQSGEDPGYSIEQLELIIKTIKAKFPALIFISFGELGRKGLQRLYDAGARGMLLRFETSNPKLYEKFHCGDSFKERVCDLRDAYDIGYLILTGGLIGLEGQSYDDLLNDILLTKELHAEMYSFGPVLPKGPKTEDVLKVIAVGRIVDPANAKIVVTTGFETLEPRAREMGLLAGANSMMLNVTPIKYRKMYSIYPNRAHVEDEIAKQIEEAVALLKSLGRAPTDIGTT